MEAMVTCLFLWSKSEGDYEQIWDDGIGRNNGRVYVALANSLGTLPESEMDRIELFDTVPENYTYSREEEIKDIETIFKMLSAYELMNYKEALQ